MIKELRFDFFLALRYLFPSRRKVFFLTPTLAGISGLALGVSSLIIALGISNGFHKEIKDKILSLTPHLIVSIPQSEFERLQERISELDYIVASSIFSYQQLVIKSKKSTQGIVLKGINYDMEKNVTSIGNIIRHGGWDKDGIVLGYELAKNLGVWLDDEVLLVYSEAPHGLELFPGVERIKVKGVFATGFYEYDNSLAFIDILKFKKIFPHATMLLGLRTVDPFKVERYTDHLSKEFSCLNITSWQRLNYSLFAALKLEKIMTFLIVLLIILLACINVYLILTLIVTRKIKDVGILAALGIDRLRVARIFLLMGVLVGIIGITIGGVVGLVLSYLLKKYEFIKLPPEVYFVEKIPVEISLSELLVVLLIALILTSIASIHPAIRVSKLNPSEIIRNA